MSDVPFALFVVEGVSSEVPTDHVVHAGRTR